MSAGADLGQIIFKKVLSADDADARRFDFCLRHSAKSADGENAFIV